MMKALCRVCSSDDCRFLFTNIDRFHHLEGRFDLFRCEDCGLIFIHPQISDEAMARYYPKSYYSYNAASQDDVPGMTGRRSVWQYLTHPFQTANALVYSKCIGQNRDLAVRPGMRLLDVGCGDGAYLIKKKGEGAECYGTDISREALERLRQRHPDIRTHCGELWEASWPEGYFDAINICHVLEHVTDPEKVLREMRRVLSSSGTLKVSVPNGESWTRALFGEHWMGYDTPRHRWVFSPKSLKILFERTGLRLYGFRTLENSFSVLGSWIYRRNTKNGEKKELMSLRDVWDRESLKLSIAPYSLIVNALRKGDVAEYLLKRG